MTTLKNEIIINASIGKIWEALINIEELTKYDPTIKSSVAISSFKSGIGACRKVVMLDGKNWFEEKVTVFKPMEVLTFELTACSFPVSNLNHSYSFEKTGNQIKVKEVMEYKVKFGLVGKIMDILMVRKQSDNGIKKFFAGLKSFTENK